jgi:cobyrinic acid a,c-diamide synthase
MVENFSHEKIKLPKATILGVAEETSASIAAEINDEVKINSNRRRKTQCRVNSVADDANFETYLQDNLGYLSQAERSVMEPVLRK